MSDATFYRIKKLIEKNVKFFNFEKIKHQNILIEAEKILNVKLPLSYKLFLKDFNLFDFNGREIYGIYSAQCNEYIYNCFVCNTLDERKNENFMFPPNHIPIYDIGNGEKICLNTSIFDNSDECPLAIWSFGNIQSALEFGKNFEELLHYVVIQGLKELELENHTVYW